MLLIIILLIVASIELLTIIYYSELAIKFETAFVYTAIKHGECDNYEECEQLAKQLSKDILW